MDQSIKTIFSRDQEDFEMQLSSLRNNMYKVIFINTQVCNINGEDFVVWTAVLENISKRY
jgi:hypothetical protein